MSMTTSFVKRVVGRGGLKPRSTKKFRTKLVGLVIALMTTVSCVNTHGIVLFKQEIGSICFRVGAMKIGKKPKLGIKIERLGADGECKRKRLKHEKPIGIPTLEDKKWVGEDDG